MNPKLKDRLKVGLNWYAPGEYIQKDSCHRADTRHVKEIGLDCHVKMFCLHLVILELKVSHSPKTYKDTFLSHNILNTAFVGALHLPKEVLVPKNLYSNGDRYSNNHNSKKNKKNSQRCTNYYGKLKACTP
jgi:hypothetical protein